MENYIKLRNEQDFIAIKIRLVAEIAKAPEGGYISYCPALDLCSQGNTRKEARNNIIEAVQLFIESCFKRGTLKDVLTDCGFHLAGQKLPRRRRTSTPPFVGEGRPVRIPAEIPLMAHC